MGRILVIRGGALGEFVLTLPVLAALRDRFPRAGLDLLGYPHLAPLAISGGWVEVVHPMEARAMAGFFVRNGPLDPALSACFERYALIISFLYDPDELFQGNVRRCTSGQFLAGCHRPDDRWRGHAADAFLQVLERVAIFEADPVPRLPVGLPNLGAGEWLAVHPGSGSEAKIWPERRWADLLEKVLAALPCHLLLVGGETEAERLDRLVLKLPPDRVRVARSRPLVEVAGLLRACRLFVGHDSGITHLAAAVGVPCVVLWGPAELRRWRPLGERVVILQDDEGLVALGGDLVWEVLRREWSLKAPA